METCIGSTSAAPPPLTDDNTMLGRVVDFECCVQHTRCSRTNDLVYSLIVYVRFHFNYFYRLAYLPT